MVEGNFQHAAIPNSPTVLPAPGISKISSASPQRPIRAELPLPQVRRPTGSITCWRTVCTTDTSQEEIRKSCAMNRSASCSRLQWKPWRHATGQKRKHDAHFCTLFVHSEQAAKVRRGQSRRKSSMNGESQAQIHEAARVSGHTASARDLKGRIKPELSTLFQKFGHVLPPLRTIAATGSLTVAALCGSP